MPSACAISPLLSATQQIHRQFQQPAIPSVSVASSQQAPSEMFHFFPKFPKEIRLAVWEAVCDEERIIPVLLGVGHFSPVTHRQLAIPPLLHACAESREVGLHRYNLRFHPRVYTNPDRDYVMRHVWYPHQRIDQALYQNADFDWEALPRLAVFIDDISFQQHEFCLTQRAKGPEETREKKLWPFSSHFLWSISSRLGKPKPAALRERELLLLVLPPLTARPNPVAQRIDMVTDAGATAHASQAAAIPAR